MTPFRHNLEQLRREYRAEGYPGDLVADVLDKVGPIAGDNDASARDERHELLDGGPIPIGRGAASRWRTMFLPMAMTAAIAAGIAVAVTLVATRGLQQDRTNDGNSIASHTGGNENTRTTTGRLPGANETRVAINDSTRTSRANEGNGASQTTDAGPVSPTTSQTESFTVVPSVATIVGEDTSLVPAAPSFDFDLSQSTNSYTTGGESAEN